jgi:hypothetical protein
MRVTSCKQELAKLAKSPVGAQAECHARSGTQVSSLDIRLVLDFAPKTLSVRSVIYSVL